MWSPRTDLTVRASLAAGFRPPATFDEDLHIALVNGEGQVIRNDPRLSEESSFGQLLSLEWRPTFGRKGSASIGVNLFRTDLDELMNVVEADDPTTPEAEFLRVNQGDALVEGVEISASARWGSRWSADFGFVQQSSRFGEPEPDFGSRDFFRTPDRYGSIGLIYRLTNRLDLFTGIIYTGKMKAPHYAGFIDEDRLETTPSFLTVDLNLSRTFEPPSGLELKMTGGVKNLTDDYQPDLDQGPDRDAGYVYGPRLPRQFFVGASTRF